MLLSPLEGLGLSHRVVMAPLTRVRANQRFACGPTAVKYYAERASQGGLLITEGCPVCPEAQYEYAAGIYTPEQEEAWKAVVDEVHARGCKISLQLWHPGRMIHSSWSKHPFLQSLGRPLPSVSCSATKPPGQTRTVDGTNAPYTEARELSRADIARLVQDFEQAASAAKRCGFDFVEIHGAHGYLFDQFICDSTNLRHDEFGVQSAENRTRALQLVLRAVIGVMGTSSRVALRLSPTYTDSFAYQGCKDSNPERTYREVLAQMNKFGLGYLLLTEPRWSGGRANFNPSTDPTFSLPLRNVWAKEVYKGVIIGSSSFLPASAEQALRDGIYDAIAFGRWFIANPDFVDRLRSRRSLNKYDTSTFYLRDDVKGYIDYPLYDCKGTFPQIDAEEAGASQSKPESGKSPGPVAGTGIKPAASRL